MLILTNSVAGSHSTSGTLTLLLWNISQNPQISETAAKEIWDSLGPLEIDQVSYPIQGLEASLNYTMACVRENFRLNPVFTMPLWRRVGYPGGVDIGNHHIPQGVSFISPYFSVFLISTKYS